MPRASRRHLRPWRLCRFPSLGFTSANEPELKLKAWASAAPRWQPPLRGTLPSPPMHGHPMRPCHWGLFHQCGPLQCCPALPQLARRCKLLFNDRHARTAFKSHASAPVRFFSEYRAAIVVGSLSHRDTTPFNLNRGFLQCERSKHGQPIGARNGTLQITDARGDVRAALRLELVRTLIFVSALRSRIAVEINH